MSVQDTSRPETPGRALLGALVADQLGYRTASVLEAAVEGLSERAAERCNRQAMAQQANIEAVIDLAAGFMTDAKPENAIDPGWLDHFFDAVRYARQDVEQTVWARLLVAEVGAPGAIARRTLAFLRNMDFWEIESFSEYCSFSFAFESGWRFMFDEDIARREMWSYGREIDLTQHWINIGLLAAETQRLEARSARGLQVRYRERSWVLRASGDGLPEDGGGFAYRRFTPTGQQIAGAVRTKPFNGYARNLVQDLGKSVGLAFDLLETADTGK